MATNSLTPFQMIPEYQEVKAPLWDAAGFLLTPLSYLVSFLVKEKNLPPSAPGHALVGSWPELKAMNWDILRFVVSYGKKYGKEEGLCQLRIGNKNFFIVTNPVLAKSILNQPESFKRGGSLRVWRKFSEGGLSEGKETQEYRTQAIHFIGAKNLSTFFRYMNQISHEWNARLLQKRKFNLFHESERMALGVMGEIFFRQTFGDNPFGLDQQNDEKSDIFLSSYRNLFEILMGRVTSALSSIPYIGDTLYNWLYPLDDIKIQVFKDSLKGILAPIFKTAFETYDETNEEAKKLYSNFGIDPKNVDLDDLLDKSLGFLQASFETSSKAIAWILYELAKDQSLQDRLRRTLREKFGDKNPESIAQLKEATFLFKTVREGLRIYTPFPTLVRDKVEAGKVEEFDIEAGETFIISPLLLHHDPKVWNNPEKFDPDRFTEEMLTDTWMTGSANYLTFLDGMHRCPGRFFAEIEIAMVLANLIKDYRVTLENPDIVPELKSNITLFTNVPVNVVIGRLDELD